jgi:hypothetical protein
MLLQTELAKDKSMLFGYADKKVKEWTTLKKYMEGNHLTLLNLGKFIEQALRFDLYLAPYKDLDSTRPSRVMTHS